MVENGLGTKYPLGPFSVNQPVADTETDKKKMSPERRRRKVFMELEVCMAVAFIFS